ncbi:class I SAM-dependent methyltransferase [bacterium]|nr:class I SAM-dependent methyltransferase [bacterium]
MNCRHCKTVLEHTFLDLGFAPPSNAYLSTEQLNCPETYFPLKVKVCSKCWLVQTEDYTQADDLFREDYAYFSSTSTGWLKHAAKYCSDITKRLGLTSDSFVIEVASNDGYLLKNFVAENVPCLGIEPTAGTAAAAEKIGIPVLKEFFGEALGKKLAQSGKSADLVAGNNVYAHVPDINDFTAGLAAILKPEGTITLEFPHLMQLIEHNQFDTIYHEHFSYLSLHTVTQIFATCGLRIYDVEQIPTHGGSLRIFGCHTDDSKTASVAVAQILEAEQSAGLQDLKTYLQFQQRADRVKNDFLNFLIEQKTAGKKVVAYGAAAKGNTLINYAGVKPDLLPSVADAATSKQNKFLPGSHIPVVAPEVLVHEKPDYVIILPWNIAQEVMIAQKDLTTSGCRFVTFVPQLKVH